MNTQPLVMLGLGSNQGDREGFLRAAVAALRGLTPAALSRATTANALQALPGLAHLSTWPMHGA